MYGYSRNNPLLYVDIFGLKCTVVDSLTTQTNRFEHEDVVYGNWIYDTYDRFNVKCWCIYYRDLRIDVIRIDAFRVQKALKCTEKDECGVESIYYKYETSYEKDVETFSKSGGREYEQRL